MASGLKNLTIDTSTEGFLHDDDPTLVTYYEFRKQYGRDEMVQLTIVADNIFSEPFMVKLKSLHHEIKQGVSDLNGITSLINARNTTGSEGSLQVDNLLALLLLNDWQTGSGGVLRLSGEYELSDALAVTVGLVDYLVADALPYSALEDNDRLFIKMAYSF
jgi:hypothetical protein